MSLAILDMNVQHPNIRHLTLADYHTKPWKNGKGLTQDILLLPEGADHANFDLRFALSPIVEDGLFSAFNGVDRVITMIEGNALELEFGPTCSRIELFGSLRFDTGVAPMGRPIGGPVRVINVMARRGIWDISDCKITTALNINLNDGDLLFIHAISNGCIVRIGTTSVVLGLSDTAVVSGAFEVKSNGSGQCLVVHIKPLPRTSQSA